MRFSFSIGAVLLPFASVASGIELNPDDEASIRAATQQYAHGLMSLYKGNATGLPKEEIGFFPKPHYWWEAGAAWGGMIEYTQFTGDTSHVKTLHQALVANYGPANDILLPWKKDQEGNDDQAFWALAIMSALEYQFPDPGDSAPATYLQVAENCFNNIVARWDTTSCNGGLKWQIYPENAYGYNYKNSISNGATFALAARLARYTGNQTYADWAVKLWDWTEAVGLISDKYEVFDGTDDRKNCSDRDHTEWSYNIGIYLHGAAALYNYTNGDETWKKHTAGLLDHSGAFFQPYENATDIMYELACETGETGRNCNLDQQSFKAYLSRFLAKTAIMAPFTKERVTKWLRTSAEAAAKSCTGGADGSTCGSKWYTGGWDGTSGVGQQLSALEVTQALLTLKQGIVPRVGGEVKPSPSSSATPVASSTSAAVVESSTGPTSTQAAPEPPKSEAPKTEAPSPRPNTETPSPEAPKTENPTPESPNTETMAVATSSADASSIPSDVPAASSAVDAIPTSQPGGGFYEGPSSASDDCTCTPSSTLTVYVPPPATVITTPSLPTTGNATLPTSPPSNTTGPVLFPGAAANTKVTSLSILAAAALVITSGLL